MRERSWKAAKSSAGRSSRAPEPSAASCSERFSLAMNWTLPLHPPAGTADGAFAIAAPAAHARRILRQSGRHRDIRLDEVHRYSVEAYHRLIELGAFEECERVELLEGTPRPDEPEDAAA